MDAPPTVGEMTLHNYPRWRSGKVRDVFDLGDRLLFVATDRISAFDVVLPNVIPDKGRLLTAISRYWFEQTEQVCPNHVVAYDIGNLDLQPDEPERLDGRSMQARKADRIDVECVVRGYLAGSGWEEYRQFGTLAGEPLPPGLNRGDELPEPRFTPATKNDDGHDENISIDELRNVAGAELAGSLERTSQALFSHAQSIARDAGFVLADTKFEFGFVDGQLTLIDEVLTPDSSRYWNIADLQTEAAPSGFDKQVIRDWLTTSGWNREPPAPELPADIVQLARERYADVLKRLKSARE